MKKLIDRYIYDVTRRLPEQERDEVAKELRSNIRDMLPEDATEQAVRAVLTELGAPVLLAEQYRQNPRCLISAAFFDTYLRTLKWVVPLVGCILLVIGLLQGGADAAKDGITDVSGFAGSIIGSGISSGISGAIQALVWVTAGFAIADRVSGQANLAENWSVEDLPDIPANKKVISLSDSIVELLIIAFFSTVGVLLCVGRIPVSLILRGEGVQIYQPFSNSFLTACIPVIIIGGALGICECMVKIIKRRWTLSVCAAAVISNLAGIGLTLYLCFRQDIFSQDFLALARRREWIGFGESGIGNPFVMLFAAIVIVVSLAECGRAIYRTVRDGTS